MSASSVSGFEQSLNPDKHRTMANIYLSQHPELSIADLEFNLWPRLVANIEACLEVTRQVAGFKVGPLVLQGLTNRYAAVNSLLDEPASALPRLVHIGVDTILVEPTLAYYVGIFAEDILGLEHFDSVVDEGLLPEALYYAALMVRFLNDLGPVLLTQTECDRSTFVYMLTRPFDHSEQSLFDVLENAPGGLRPYLTRIRKDILHGEFNISLYGITQLPARQAIPVFEQRLNYLSTLYTQAEARLAELLDQISDRLGDSTTSHLILRFVRFHEHIYRHEYDEPVGEYTV
jgi:hypothetical protein